MRRAVFFVPDEDAFVKRREELLAETSPGTLEHFEAALHLWIARYSRGDEPAVLNQAFREELFPTAEAFSQSGTPLDLRQMAQYQTALQFLSIGILMNAPSEHLGPLATRLIGSGQDAVIDRLLQAIASDLEPTDALLHPDPYTNLISGAQQAQPLQQRNDITRFLRRYYATLEGVVWYDSHLTPDAGFFGYWSFELAVFVKRYKLDDRPFADNIFYPRDLTGDRLLRTWLPTGYGDSQRNALAKLQAAWQKQADAQASKIDSQFQHFQDSIRSFVETALSIKDSPASEKRVQSQFQRSAHSLQMLSELTGLDPKQLDANPALAKTLITSLLQSVSAAARKAGKSPMPVDEIEEAIREEAEKEGVTLDELAADMPAELREHLESAPKSNYEDRMKGFSSALDQLIAEDELQEDELVAALQKLSVEYGLSEPEPTIQEKTKARLDKKWDEIRKGKQMIDFTFEDLFNGKGVEDQPQ